MTRTTTTRTKTTVTTTTTTIRSTPRMSWFWWCGWLLLCFLRNVESSPSSSWTLLLSTKNLHMNKNKNKNKNKRLFNSHRTAIAAAGVRQDGCCCASQVQQGCRWRGGAGDEGGMVDSNNNSHGGGGNGGGGGSMGDKGTTMTTTAKAATAAAAAATTLAATLASSPSSSSSSSSTLSVFDAVSDSQLKCWIVLLISVLIENLATGLLKMARHSSSQRTAVLGLVSSAALFLLGNVGLFAAVTHIDLGIAYAVWSAAGTTIMTIVGVVCFGESYNLMKLVYLSLIVLGVVGLSLQGE